MVIDKVLRKLSPVDLYRDIVALHLGNGAQQARRVCPTSTFVRPNCVLLAHFFMACVAFLHMVKASSNSYVDR
jgi:hypothetical protein